MNIFEFAMQMEKDGEAYYRELADRAGNEGLRRIFGMMADDEVKHYQIFEALAREMSTSMADTVILNGAVNIFKAMDASTVDASAEADQVAAYQKAQQVEAESRDWYLEKARELGEGPQASFLTRIAEEEQKHYRLLGHIIEFVTRPSHWIEQAEFNHLEDF